MHGISQPLGVPHGSVTGLWLACRQELLHGCHGRGDHRGKTIGNGGQSMAGGLQGLVTACGANRLGYTPAT